MSQIDYMIAVPAICIYYAVMVWWMLKQERILMAAGHFFLVCGAVLNYAVIAMNNWKMPVFEDWFYPDQLHSFGNSFSKWKWACDRLWLGCSVGDVIIFCGVVLLLVSVFSRIDVKISKCEESEVQTGA